MSGVDKLFGNENMQLLTGMFSPSYMAKHKDVFIPLAAAAAAYFTGGASLGLMGAGAGAAEAGAGAAAGGLAGAEGVGAGAGLLGLESGAGAAAGGLAGASEIGAGAGTMGPFDTFMANGGLSKIGGGLSKFGKLARLGQSSGLLGQPGQPPIMSPPSGVRQAPLTQTSGLPSLQQMYGQPVIDDEKRRRLAMLMQQRGIYGG